MRRRWLATAAVVVGALTTGSVLMGATTASSNPDANSGGAATKSKTVTRVFLEDGVEKVVDRRDVTVRVTQTRELRGRQRIGISWTGAHPSAARAADPFGERGMAQEYPVVILQCRGVDDPAAPVAQQVSPETCWTSGRVQRSQLVSDRAAVWRKDLYADEAAREQRSGLTPFPAPEVCSQPNNFSVRVTPFRAADGRVFPACSAETMPPEAAVGAAFPPAEQAAFTDLDGRGSTQFEVRTSVENESLGCSHTQDCTLVVIPIMGISCAEPDAECRKAGRFVAGSSNFANEGVDAAVSPIYWWSASNWRNRISFPLTFGLPPDACDVLDRRAPTGFFGSELFSQAALQWSPAFCLRKDRFKFQHNRMPDEAAFALMENGDAVAALVSGPREESGTPVAYAPTAVTGFGIGYVIDRPGNTGEFTDLRMTPRLAAKLLTQSYPGSSLGQQRPGIAGNPLSMNLDPEFTALNPDLDRIPREAMATLLSLSESSDVITALTEWIAADPDASAFIAGKADPWGMTVNPAYRGLELPVAEWPLLDTFIPESQLECLIQNPAPYLTKVAAPVTSFRKIAEAVLDGWPNVQTKCDRPVVTEPFRVGRVDRQGLGSRMMLGIVSLGDASRFGLRLASLQTAPRTFVAPTERSILSTLRLAEQEAPGQPFTWTQEQVRKARTAYPGTSVIYTAARTAGMPKADATKVASFIRISMAETQRPGPGNGQLPGGFVPIRRDGPTAPLYRSALAVAEVVAAQSGGERPSRPKPPAGPDADDADGNPPGFGDGSGSTDPVAAPDETPADPGNPLPVVEADGETLRTLSVTSGVAGSLLPTLIVVLAVAIAASIGLQLSWRLRGAGGPR